MEVLWQINETFTRSILSNYAYDNMAMHKIYGILRAAGSACMSLPSTYLSLVMRFLLVVA